MRTSLGVTAFALLALVTGTAASQQQPAQQEHLQPQEQLPQDQLQQQEREQAQEQQLQPQEQPQPQPQQQHPLPAAADQVVGKTVISREGKELGEVKDVLVTGEGKVEALVLSQGGIAGVGGRSVAVPWNKISIRGDQLTADMSEQEISQLPEYKEGQ